MNVVRDIRHASAGTGGGHRASVIAEAVALLASDGGPSATAIVPSECGYLLVAAGAAALKGQSGDRLLNDVDEVEEILGPLKGVQRKLVRRLLPGPCVVCRRVDGELVHLRLPRHPVCRTLVTAWRAEREGEPLFARELLTDSGRPIRDAAEATAAAAGIGVTPALVLDDGTSTLGEPATIIELPARGQEGGAYRVLRSGAYEERYIAKMAERTILFVCTGNTCRSPMAAAIAEHLLRRAFPGGANTRILSAGTAAGGNSWGDGDDSAAAGGGGGGGGSPATREGIDALAELGIDKPATPHRSRQLTRAMIDDADVIWAMTRSHLSALRRLESGSPAGGGAEKAELLDPDGDDVPDPAGMSAAVYRQTAERLRALIERRLKEMEA